ncbi:hypothetical protein BKA62DRAFT_767574 [Auriculariales sp. MPI-PUGE-AT-0066]|nr:hypothetical protein BKA62DRAFT_767574 [Auriculariales sp. MPI-PUGE-AT-0066]
MSTVGSALSRQVAAAKRWARPGTTSMPSPPVSSLRKPVAPWHGPKYAQHNGPTPARWLQNKQALKERFPEGWNPPKKLSRETMDGLRALHHAQPEVFTTSMLANKFRVSPEAVRRILKSKWVPSREREVEMMAKEKSAKQAWFDDERRTQHLADGQGDRPLRARGDRLVLTHRSRWPPAQD